MRIQKEHNNNKSYNHLNILVIENQLTNDDVCPSTCQHIRILYPLRTVS